MLSRRFEPRGYVHVRCLERPAVRVRAITKRPLTGNGADYAGTERLLDLLMRICRVQTYERRSWIVAPFW